MISQKIKFKKLTALLIWTAFFYSIPVLTLAASFVPCGGSGQEDCKLCDLFVMFDNIVRFILFNFVPPIAALILVVGGIMFFSAAGDPAKIGKAKAVLTATVLGLVIVYGAWLFINSFLSVIGVSQWTGLKEGWFKYPCH